MDRNKKIYFEGAESFNEFLENIEAGDYCFYYKGRPYIITIEEVKGVPKHVIAAMDGGPYLRDEDICPYNSFEELLLKHKFEDGVPLLKAFESCKDIEPY